MVRGGVKKNVVADLFIETSRNQFVVGDIKMNAVADVRLALEFLIIISKRYDERFRHCINGYEQLSTG